MPDIPEIVPGSYMELHSWPPRMDADQTPHRVRVERWASPLHTRVVVRIVQEDEGLGPEIVVRAYNLRKVEAEPGALAEGMMGDLLAQKI